MNTLFTFPSTENLETPIPGIVELPISANKPGRVKCQGSYWPARFAQPYQTTVLPDEIVTVVGIYRLTLLVMPFNNSN